MKLNLNCINTSETVIQRDSQNCNFFLASVCFKKLWFTSAPTVNQETDTAAQLLVYD